MAYVTETPRAAAGLPLGWISELVEGYKLSRARRAAYLRTYGELNAMSEKELADIGLSSLMIRDISLEAAKRATA